MYFSENSESLELRLFRNLNLYFCCAAPGPACLGPCDFLLWAAAAAAGRSLELSLHFATWGQPSSGEGAEGAATLAEGPGLELRYASCNQLSLAIAASCSDGQPPDARRIPLGKTRLAGWGHLHWGLHSLGLVCVPLLWVGKEWTGAAGCVASVGLLSSPGLASALCFLAPAPSVPTRLCLGSVWDLGCA